MAEALVLTDEQRAAIEAPGAAVVRAGAGCGKTAVLAGRFVHLLEPRTTGEPAIEVAQILAITFTEKAAAEMKRRIRDLVVERERAADAAGRRHWERVRRDLLGAQISTIHAFCARVLRENPLEAGIDPHASVLDEHESRDYLERLVEAELTRRVRARHAGARGLLARTRGLRGARRSGAVRLVVGLLDALARAGRTGPWLRAATHDHVDVAAAAAALGEARERFGAAVEAWLARDRDGAAADALRERWDADRAWLADLERLDPEVAVAGLRRLAAAIAKTRDAALRAHLALDKRRPVGALGEAYAAWLAAPETLALAGLVDEVWQAVEAQKQRDAVLTFDDLVRGARRLLAELPGVRRRYTSRLRAVLVDELQDTDAVQADLIRLLTGEAGTALFAVGDEKQSIYRFRGADVAVFAETAARIGASYPLGRNFRSQPEILAVVNALADAMFGDPAQRLVAARSQVRRTPSVRLITLAEELARREVNAAGAREIEARVLAEVLIELTERPEDPVSFGDVAVLFRALTQVKAYEYALARRGVPYYVVKGRGFFQAQEVRDVVSLLAAVAQPADSVALAAVLRSPLVALDDDTLWRLAWPEAAERPRLAGRFRPGAPLGDLGAEAERVERARDLLLSLRRLHGRIPIAELLLRAIGATDLEAVYLTQFQGEQKVANLRKVIELARRFDRRGGGGVAEFVAWLRQLDADEPREAEAPLTSEGGGVVRLMTIHQAKGLEFPVVVLVDLARALESDNATVVVDRTRGLVAAPVHGPGAHPLRHPVLEAHRTEERGRARAEHARLLYVAATRAQDELVLLEGFAKAKALGADGRKDADLWCHRVWSLVGTDAVQAASRGGAAVEARVAGARVAIEPASAYLERESGRIDRRPARAPEVDDADAHALVARVLAFRSPRPREVVSTPTALATFRGCPRRYWYRHVLGMDERAGGGRRGQLLGVLAHGMLERTDPARPLDDAEARALALGRPESLRLGERELTAVAHDVAAATRAIADDVARGLAVLGREVAVTLALPARGPRLVLDGRIDLLGRRAGVLVVQDYKYAAPAADALAEYGDQLAAYRLAVARRFGEVVAGELLFLRGEVRRHVLPPLDGAACEAALLETGEALGEALAAGEPAAFPRRPADAAACERLGCGYVRRCWRAAAAAVTGSAPDDRSDRAGA